jgi:hypothetical protein
MTQWFVHHFNSNPAQRQTSKCVHTPKIRRKKTKGTPQKSNNNNNTEPIHHRLHHELRLQGLLSSPSSSSSIHARSFVQIVEKKMSCKRTSVYPPALIRYSMYPVLWMIKIPRLQIRPPLHYGEGLWPWNCWEPSKHIQRLSCGDSEIIYVWVPVVKCNVNWK